MGAKNMDDKDILSEDTTKYGEFISSYFSWIPISQQKERAEELQNMTKRKKQSILYIFFTSLPRLCPLLF